MNTDIKVTVDLYNILVHILCLTQRYSYIWRFKKGVPQCSCGKPQLQLMSKDMLISTSTVSPGTETMSADVTSTAHRGCNPLHPRTYITSDLLGSGSPQLYSVCLRCVGLPMLTSPLASPTLGVRSPTLSMGSLLSPLMSPTWGTSMFAGMCVLLL